MAEKKQVKGTTQLVDTKMPRLGGHPGKAVFYSIFISSLIFLLLPLSQYLSWNKERSIHRIEDFSVPPPPPPPPRQEIEEEEPEEEEELEMKQERMLPSLDQLELSLSTDLQGDLGGDFAMPSFEVNDNSLGDMIFELEDLDELPRPIRRIGPIYPAELRREGISGSATVLFIVDENGAVRNARIETSTHQEFEKPALDALRRWTFSPGVKGGRKVKTRMRQPFSFSVKK